MVGSEPDRSPRPSWRTPGNWPRGVRPPDMPPATSGRGSVVCAWDCPRVSRWAVRTWPLTTSIRGRKTRSGLPSGHLAPRSAGPRWVGAAPPMSRQVLDPGVPRPPVGQRPPQSTTLAGRHATKRPTPPGGPRPDRGDPSARTEPPMGRRPPEGGRVVPRPSVGHDGPTTYRRSVTTPHPRLRSPSTRGRGPAECHETVRGVPVGYPRQLHTFMPECFRRLYWGNLLSATQLDVFLHGGRATDAGAESDLVTG